MKPTQLSVDIILVLVVLAGIASFFINPLGIDMKALQLLASGIVGFIIKGGEVPIMRAFPQINK